mgnify:CR=1 FL=1
MVIDDYQHLAQEPTAEELIDAVIARGTIPFFVTSRVRPSWVSAKRLLYGEVAEFGPDVQHHIIPQPGDVATAAVAMIRAKSPDGNARRQPLNAPAPRRFERYVPRRSAWSCVVFERAMRSWYPPPNVSFDRADTSITTRSRRIPHARRERCERARRFALGTRLRVRTLDGKKVLLRIPPGTQPGRRFRIKGQGIEKNGRRGDQLVGVQVTVPDQLTPEQQDLMKRFADSAGLKY